jgi:hypothetical protein
MTADKESTVPIDLSALSGSGDLGDAESCCHQTVIHVELDGDGNVRVWAMSE